MPRACVVQFKDLGKSWSVEKIMQDTTIKKYCVLCGNELLAVEIQEKGEVTEILYCDKCAKEKHGHD